MEPDVQQESGPIYSDMELEAELRLALKSEPEIDLFKEINKAMRVKDELANNESVKAIVRDMWKNVADFMDSIINADTLAGLTHKDQLVVSHKDMQANFRAVAAINAVFKDADMAEAALSAQDEMQREQEDSEL